MAHYTVDVGGKSYDVDADTPQAAAMAAHQVASRAPAPQGPKPGVVDDAVSGFAAPFAKLGRDVLDSYRRKTAEATAPLPSLGEAAKRSLQDLADVPRIAGDVLGLGGAPFQAAIRPVARAISTAPVRPWAAPQLSVGLGGISLKPAHAMSGDEAQAAIEGDLNTALQGARSGMFSPNARAHGITLGDARAFNMEETPVSGRGLGQQVRSAAPQVPVQLKATKPELRAAAALQRAAQRDAVSGVGPKVGTIPFQTHGENVATVAEVLAQSPGAANQLIRKVATNQAATAPDRIKSAIATGLGGRGDYFATLDAAQGERRAAAFPLLDSAFASPIDSVAYNSKVGPLMGRLPRGALDHAYDLARKAGENPEDLGFVRKPVPGGGSVDVQVSNPSMKTLHYIKKGLDQTLEQYRNPVTRELDLSGSPGAQVDSQVRKALGKTMRDINPDYDKAMQIWGDDSDQINALELGRNVFSPKFDMQAERLKGMVGEMSDASQANFRKGVGEALLAKVRSGRGGIGAMRDLLKSEEFGDRVALAFPDNKAFADFMGTAEAEVADANRRNTILSNSRTDARGAARADLNDEGAHPLDVAADVLTLNPGGLARSAARAAIKSLPKKDRSLVGDPRTNLALGKALTDQDEMTRLLNLLEASRNGRVTRVRGMIGAGAMSPPQSVQPGQKVR